MPQCAQLWVPSPAPTAATKRGLSLPTGSLKEGRGLANLSSSFFVWGRRYPDGDLQAKGKCQSADLHVGKMPAGFWYSGGRQRGAEGVVPQRRGNVLIHPAYICLKGLLCFATFSHVTGYRKVLLVVSPQALLLSPCCPGSPSFSAGPAPALRTDESYPHPPPPH